MDIHTYSSMFTAYLCLFISFLLHIYCIFIEYISCTCYAYFVAFVLHIYFIFHAYSYCCIFTADLFCVLLTHIIFHWATPFKFSVMLAFHRPVALQVTASPCLKLEKGRCQKKWSRKPVPNSFTLLRVQSDPNSEICCTYAWYIQEICN
jgi:hypothetical protein